MNRRDGRLPQQMRSLNFVPDFVSNSLASVLVQWGQTKVLCCANVSSRLPAWLLDSGKGWITAEYSMLPGSTHSRSEREAAKGRQGGRTLEIQRLIGRALRATTDLERLGPLQITIDCDVLQADGGTRTASISGGYVALAMALERLRRKGTISTHCRATPVAAVSVGLLGQDCFTDLDYSEDSNAAVDLNVVFLPQEQLIEVQGTGEKSAFTPAQLQQMLAQAFAAGEQIFAAQQEVLATISPVRP